MLRTITRPFCAIGLAALACTALSATASAQQPRGYPGQPQFPAPQYSAPQNRSPYCAQLEGQLAALKKSFEKIFGERKA